MILKWDFDLAEPSFDTVLDTTCRRLWERHIQYSIRRIGEMEEELNSLERTLDELDARLAWQAGPETQEQA